MGQRGGQPHLGLEAREGSRVGRVVRPDQLHGTRALQELVLGQVDLAHPAGAEPPPEAILADLAGLGDLPAQPGERAGPEGRADREHEQDHRVKEKQADAWGLAQLPSLPEPPHRVGILQQ